MKTIQPFWIFEWLQVFSESGMYHIRLYCKNQKILNVATNDAYDYICTDTANYVARHFAGLHDLRQGITHDNIIHRHDCIHGHETLSVCNFSLQVASALKVSYRYHKTILFSREFQTCSNFHVGKEYDITKHQICI